MYLLIISSSTTTLVVATYELYPLASTQGWSVFSGDHYTKTGDGTTTCVKSEDWPCQKRKSQKSPVKREAKKLFLLHTKSEKREE